MMNYDLYLKEVGVVSQKLWSLKWWWRGAVREMSGK